MRIDRLSPHLRSGRLLRCAIWKRSNANMKKSGRGCSVARLPLLPARRRHAVLPRLNNTRAEAKGEAVGMGETTTVTSGTRLLHPESLSSSTIRGLLNRTRALGRGGRSRAMSERRMIRNLRGSRSAVLVALIAAEGAGLEWATGVPVEARLRKRNSYPFTKDWRIAPVCVDGTRLRVAAQNSIEMLDDIAVTWNKLGKAPSGVDRIGNLGRVWTVF